MKIAVITLHRIFNYGSVFQAYATQKLLEEKGNEVVIIDYIPKQRSLKRMLFAPAPKGYNNITAWVYKLLRSVSILLKELTFTSFLKKNLSLTHKYRDINQLKCDIPIADVYVTGSDQTWNSKYNEGIDRCFYLDFVPEKSKRISFVSSFGATSISESEKLLIKNYLKKYSALSVREDSAQSILFSLGFKESKWLIDPTLQIEKKVWYKLASKRLVKKPYLILMLLYSEDNGATEYARKIADCKGLELIKLSWDIKKDSNIDKLMTHRKPEDFLSLFYYADFVVTNSFHGTAFSINFEKEFVVVPRDEFNSRIESLLYLTGLSNRMITNIDEAINASFHKIDYIPVRKIINNERKRADEFLSESINNITLRR